MPSFHLMIQLLSKQCESKLSLLLVMLSHLFREAYPECEVDEVQFAYDVHRLSKLSEQRLVVQLYK